jgi:hypothetical protein
MGRLDMNIATVMADMASRVHLLDPLSEAELESVISALHLDGVIDHQHLLAMVLVEETRKAI